MASTTSVGAPKGH